MLAFVTQIRRIVLLALLTLPLVASGFAHRMPDADDQTVAVMLAAGASVADICGAAGDGRRHADPLCQACQIAGGGDLPSLAGPVRPAALLLLAEVTAPRENARAARVLDLSRAPQGPPVG
ncbi:MAG: hypothetical protein U1E69_04270 [Tabrizicola sp.]|uniref:hypothetical protein n=1 Tax=Tabrizicola sp. TaxID=2005166 RepID=UPI002AB867D2|nr:hypothetical protein [Tabrizicola sp.]MDZ4085999.1 hypothetical protein [Tabrizicola sp.]